MNSRQLLSLRFKIFKKQIRLWFKKLNTAIYISKTKREFDQTKKLEKKLDELEKKEAALEASPLPPKTQQPKIEQKLNPQKYQQLSLLPPPTELPEGYAIDENGLPYKTNRKYGWGREFNAFITTDGKCYHRSKCDVFIGKKKILIHRYNAMEKYKPCELCHPRTDIARWWQQI